MSKFTYVVNKPERVVNQKSGYTSSQDTDPNRPITIMYDGKKVLDVYGTITQPKLFTTLLVEMMNADIEGSTEELAQII